VSRRIGISAAGLRKLPAWQNQRLVVYHGTDSTSVSAIGTGSPVPFVVDLMLCKPNTDFGQGFYVTTRLHQAQQWANSRALRNPAPGIYAVVLQFDLDRDWLASLDTLGFVRPTRDFWNLVSDCRLGFAPHQRTPPHPVPYDTVFGPVTLWPQTMIIANCDQIGFHTRRAVASLPVPTLHSRANQHDKTRLRWRACPHFMRRGMQCVR
jgi:hypothetical protein